MRCYVAGVQHESGSFSPIPTSFRSFVQVRWGVDGPQRSHVMGYGEACDLELWRLDSATGGPG